MPALQPAIFSVDKEKAEVYFQNHDRSDPESVFFSGRDGGCRAVSHANAGVGHPTQVLLGAFDLIDVQALR